VKTCAATGTAAECGERAPNITAIGDIQAVGVVNPMRNSSKNCALLLPTRSADNRTGQRDIVIERGFVH